MFFVPGHPYPPSHLLLESRNAEILQSALYEFCYFRAARRGQYEVGVVAIGLQQAFLILKSGKSSSLPRAIESPCRDVWGISFQKLGIGLFQLASDAIFYRVEFL